MIKKCCMMQMSQTSILHATRLKSWIGDDNDDLSGLDENLLNGQLTRDEARQYLESKFDYDSAAFQRYVWRTATDYVSFHKRNSTSNFDAIIQETGVGHASASEPKKAYVTIGSLVNMPVIKLLLSNGEHNLEYYYAKNISTTKDQTSVDIWLNRAIKIMIEADVRTAQKNKDVSMINQWAQSIFGVTLKPTTLRFFDQLICNYKLNGIAEDYSAFIVPESDAGHMLDMIIPLNYEYSQTAQNLKTRFHVDKPPVTSPLLDTWESLNDYVRQWNHIADEIVHCTHGVGQKVTPGLLKYYISALNNFKSSKNDVDQVMLSTMKMLANMCGPGMSVDLNAVDLEVSAAALKLCTYLKNCYLPYLMSIIRESKSIHTARTFCMINQFDEPGRFPYFVRTGEDEMVAIELGTSQYIKKLTFNQCFDTTFESIASTASFMGISNNLVARRGCLITSFGYSGVGKTTTLFGNDQTAEKGIIGSVISGAVGGDTDNSAGTHNDATCSVSEIYGLRLGPYAMTHRFYYDQSTKRTTDETVKKMSKAELITHVGLKVAQVNNVRSTPTYHNGIFTNGSFAGTKETINNPESSRSIMITELTLTRREPDALDVERTSISSHESSESVLRSLSQASEDVTDPDNIVPFTIVDLPGLENVSTTHSKNQIYSGFSLSEILCAVHDISNGYGTQQKALRPERLNEIKNFFKTSLGDNQEIPIVGRDVSDEISSVPMQSKLRHEMSKSFNTFKISYVSPPELKEAFLRLPEIEALLSRILVEPNDKYPNNLGLTRTHQVQTLKLKPIVPEYEKFDPKTRPVADNADNKQKWMEKKDLNNKIIKYAAKDEWLRDQVEKLVRMRQLVLMKRNGQAGKKNVRGKKNAPPPVAVEDEEYDVLVNGPTVVFMFDGSEARLDGVNEVLSNNGSKGLQPTGFSLMTQPGKRQSDMLFHHYNKIFFEGQQQRIADSNIRPRDDASAAHRLEENVSNPVYVHRHEDNETPFTFVNPQSNARTTYRAKIRPARIVLNDDQPYLHVECYPADALNSLSKILDPLENEMKQRIAKARGKAEYLPFIFFGQTKSDSTKANAERIRNTQNTNSLHNIGVYGDSGNFNIFADGDGKHRAKEISDSSDVDMSVRREAKTCIDKIKWDSKSNRDVVLEVLEFLGNVTTFENLPNDPNYLSDDVISEVMGTMEGLFINQTLRDVFRFMDHNKTEENRDEVRMDDEVEKVFRKAKMSDYVNYFVFANRGKSGEEIFKRQIEALKDNKQLYSQIAVKYKKWNVEAKDEQEVDELMRRSEVSIARDDYYSGSSIHDYSSEHSISM